MVVERFEIQFHIPVDGTLRMDGMAQGGTVGHLRATFPGVGAVVGGIHVHPVEDGDAVDGQLVAELNRLRVVERAAQVTQRVAHGVLPSLIGIGIEILVDRRVGFLHLSVRSTLEGEMECLEDVPAQLEIPVPEVLLAEGERQGVGVLNVVDVSLLEFVVGT